jgi:hypothetical protein
LPNSVADFLALGGIKRGQLLQNLRFTHEDERSRQRPRAQCPESFIQA